MGEGGEEQNRCRSRERADAAIGSSDEQETIG